jgi:hypothetical protein
MTLSIPWTYHKPKMTKRPIIRNNHRSNFNIISRFPVLAAFCLTNTTVQFLLRKEFALECVSIVYEHNSLSEAELCSLGSFFGGILTDLFRPIKSIRQPEKFNLAKLLK